ncbi:alpha/beta fold hydrolase [Actinomycetota bacterium]
MAVAPRLVLVHGSRMSRTQWARYPGLLPGIECVAIDLPGHGALEAEPFTFEGALDAIDAAVGTGGVPVVLAGHSLGGYLSMAYAARSPGRLAGLALLGATGDPAGRGSAAYRGFETLIERVGPERMQRVSNALIRRLAPSGALDDDMLGGGYAAIPAAWATVREHCAPTVLADVDCPTLLLNGQLDQMRIDVSTFAAQCRDPRVEVIAHATHLFPISHVEQTCGHLAALVADVAG